MYNPNDDDAELLFRLANQLSIHIFNAIHDFEEKEFKQFNLNDQQRGKIRTVLVCNLLASVIQQCFDEKNYNKQIDEICLFVKSSICNPIACVFTGDKHEH